MLAYIHDGAVLSKKDGGLWGIDHLPEEYSGLIGAALDNYIYDKVFSMDGVMGRSFALDMLGQVRRAVGR